MIARGLLAWKKVSRPPDFFRGSFFCLIAPAKHINENSRTKIGQQFFFVRI